MIKEIINPIFKFTKKTSIGEKKFNFDNCGGKLHLIRKFIQYGAK